MTREPASQRGMVLITGADGQVARALQANAPVGWNVVGAGSMALDITRKDLVFEFIHALKPYCIINAAAYTAVDKAEEEQERAYNVNRDGAVFLAEAAKEHGARLIHISTDYVFDGLKSSPYLPADATNPLNVYGASKLAGERGVMDVLGDRCVILRTSAVYGAEGQNFVKTMLRVMAARNAASVVCDLTVSPTWVGTLADALWRIAEMPDLAGTYHFADAGVASWYDVAVAIAEEATAIGLLRGLPTVIPIRSEQRPAAALRPSYSVLDACSIRDRLGVQPTHWRTSLRTMLADLWCRQV